MAKIPTWILVLCYFIVAATQSALDDNLTNENSDRETVINVLVDYIKRQTVASSGRNSLNKDEGESERKRKHATDKTSLLLSGHSHNKKTNNDPTDTGKSQMGGATVLGLTYKIPLKSSDSFMNKLRGRVQKIIPVVTPIMNNSRKRLVSFNSKEEGGEGDVSNGNNNNNNNNNNGKGDDGTNNSDGDDGTNNGQRDDGTAETDEYEWDGGSGSKSSTVKDNETDESNSSNYDTDEEANCSGVSRNNENNYSETEDSQNNSTDKSSDSSSSSYSSSSSSSKSSDSKNTIEDEGNSGNVENVESVGTDEEIDCGVFGCATKSSWKQAPERVWQGVKSGLSIWTVKPLRAKYGRGRPLGLGYSDNIFGSGFI